LDVIRKINKQGVTLLLIEQNAYAPFRFRIAPMSLRTDGLFLSGLSRDLAGDEKVKKAYLAVISLNRQGAGPARQALPKGTDVINW